MPNNPKFISTLSSAITGSANTNADDRLKDGTDTLNANLINTLNIASAGCFVVSGGNITIGTGSTYSTYALTEIKYFRDGKYRTLSAVSAQEPTWAKNASNDWFGLIVIALNNTIAFRGSTALGATIVDGALPLLGDIPVAAVQISKALGNNVTGRKIQFLGMDKLNSEFSAVNNGTETLRINKEGTITKTVSGTETTLTLPSTTGTLALSGASVNYTQLTGTQPNMSAGLITSGNLGDAFIASSGTWNAKQNALTFGKANTNTLKLEELVATNDVLLAGTNHVKGLTYAQLKSAMSFVKEDVGLPNADDKSSATIRSEIIASNIPNLDSSKIATGILPANRGGTGLSALTTLLNTNTTKANVGLGSVDNKSSSTLQTDILSAASASDVGLGNVTNVSQSAIQSATLSAASASDVGLGNVLNKKQISTFKQNEPPTATAIGDQWYDTNDNNKLYVSESVGADEVASGEWVLVGFNKTTVGLANVDNDSTATIRAGTTASNVGLGSVTNLSAADIRSGTTASNVGLSNVTNLSAADIRAGTTKANIGLPDVENKTSAVIRGEIVEANVPNLNASKITTGTIPAVRGGTGLTALTTLLNSNTTASDVGLGSVTNESKATMFTNPTLTGTIVLPGISDLKSAVDANTVKTVRTDAQINTLAQAKITALIGGAPDSMDTLVELSEALNDDDDFAATIVTQMATKTKTFKQDAIPTSTAVGDLWIDTNDNNKIYHAASVGSDAVTAGEWVEVTINKTTIGLGNVTDVSQSAIQSATIAAITKSDVDLGNVENTSDSAKPVSSASATAIALKANIASPTFSGTVGGITKAMVGLTNVSDITTAAMRAGTTAENVGLGNVTNVSQATIQSDTLSAASASDVGLGNVANTRQTETFVADNAPTATAVGDLWIDSNDNNKMYRASATGSSNWVAVSIGKGALGLVKGDVGLGSVTNASQATIQSDTLSAASAGDVGLGSVNNTADSAKPVSTAQQTALNLKATIASPTFTGTVGGITKGMVGLGSVTNVSAASIQAGTTAANVGLGNVDNESKATMFNNPTLTGTIEIPNISNLETAVSTNTGKTGITSGQATAITSNSAKPKVFYADTPPTSVTIGDVWFRTSTVNGVVEEQIKQYRANAVGISGIVATGTSGNGWKVVVPVASRLNEPVEINGVSFHGGSNITVTAAAGTLTGNALPGGVTSSSLTTVGTITTGNWQGTAISKTYVHNSGTWANSEISQASVTQHEGAISVGNSQLSGATNLGKALLGVSNLGNSQTKFLKIVTDNTGAHTITTRTDAEARSDIGAGTSNLAVGSGSGDALAGNTSIPVDLTSDGTGVVHANNYTNTQYSVMGASNSYASGLVASGNSTHANKYLRQDGTWVVPPSESGGISSLAADTTPQLGGDLDANGNKIKAIGNADLIFEKAQGSFLFKDTDSANASVTIGPSSMKFDFQTEGGASGGEAVFQYVDSGGTARNFMTASSNTVAIENRAANGEVHIYGNTSTAGSGGRTLVASFRDTDITTQKKIIVNAQGEGISFADSDESHFVSIIPHATITASYGITLPAAQGGANTILKNDGSGNLSWAADNDTTYSVGNNGLTSVNFTSSIVNTIATNTAKTGITSGQSSAITANTAKTGISTAQSNAISANTSKTGITSGQTSAITANTSKTGITSGQTSAITANTAKTGISSSQSSAITANTSKTGITTTQAGHITANNAKAGITSTQAGHITANNDKISFTAASAVNTNTAKTGITSTQATAISNNTAKTGITSTQATAISNNTAKTGISSGQTSAISANTAKVGITTTQRDHITANNAKVTNTDVNVSESVLKTRLASGFGTALQIGDDGTTTTFPGNVIVTGTTTTANVLTTSVSNGVVFEGVNSDNIDMILKSAVATSNKTVTIPNATFTIPTQDTTYSAGSGLTLSGTTFTPNLSASHIPVLAASKITSGTLVDARIPNLATSKITSGTFLDARIPSLGASKVTSGSFHVDRIPSLAASKITSGALADARIPSLATSKITSGTFAAARIADNSILEPKLKATNTPGSSQDNYLLSYDHATTGFTWIAAGAGGENNQNAFSNVAVSGQTTAAADSATDTLTLVAAGGMTITTSGDAVTLSSANTDTNTQRAAGTNMTLSGNTLNVDDAFLKNNANDATSGVITAAGFTTTGNWTFDESDSGTVAIATIQDSGSGFNDVNTELMTSAAIQDKILSYSYVTANQSTTGNAATATKITSITNSNIVQLIASQTLTNKTINASNNTLSNIANSALTNSSITINGVAISLGGSVTTPNTVYTHPTTAGNKHIPTGGASGQFLKYTSSGTAVWATPSYTTNTNTNQLTTFDIHDGDGTQVTMAHNRELKFVEGAGLDINFTDVSPGSNEDPFDLTFKISDNGIGADQLNVSGNGTSGYVLTSDADGSFSWSAKTTNTNTTYSAGSGVTLSGTAFSHTAHTGEVTGATALTIASSVVDEANLKISNTGSNGQFLSKQSGNTGGLTWATPTNTTYSVGAGGLTQQNFTTTLKTKLDAIAASATATVDLTVDGAGTVHANNYTNTTYSVGAGGLTQQNFTTTLKTKLDAIAASANNYALTDDLASGEITQLKNIGSSTISATQWGYLGAASGAITNTDTNTTYSGGTNLTLSGTTFNVDDAFLKNNASDTTSGTLTAANYVTAGSVTIGTSIIHQNDTNNNMTFGTDTQTFKTNNTTRLDLTDSGLRIGGSGVRVTTIENNDSLGTSDTKLCTQGNVKAYVDANAGGGGGSSDFYMVAEWNDQYFTDALRNGKRFSFGAGMNNNTNTDSGTIGTEVILPKACVLKEMHFWIGNVGAEVGSNNFKIRIDKNGSEIATDYTFNMSGSGGAHVQKSFTPDVSFADADTFNLTLHDAAGSTYSSLNQIGRVRVTFRFELS